MSSPVSVSGREDGNRFISYSGKDQRWANYVAAVFQACGSGVTYMSKDSRRGFVSSFIAAALSNATDYVMIMSKSYIASTYCRQEGLWIVNTVMSGDAPRDARNVPLVAVRIDDGVLPPPFGDVIYVDWSRKYENSCLTALLRTIDMTPDRSIRSPFPRRPRSLVLKAREAEQLARQASIEFAKTNYASAAAYLESAVSMDPTVARHWNSLGWARVQNRQLDEYTVTCFRKAVDLDPEHVMALVNLAWAMAQQYEKVEDQRDNLHERLGVLSKALSLWPDNAKALYNLAFTYHQLGRADARDVVAAKLRSLSPSLFSDYLQQI